MKKNKGVTLVELIVSLVIFSIVMVGIVVFNSRNTQATIRSERRAKRVLLQEKIIEDFKGELRSSPIPGARFDSIWINSSVGDLLLADTDHVTGVTAKLEVDSFLPDTDVALSQTGIFLKVGVTSTDMMLNIEERTSIYISRHD
ncbi:type II secretion system protein [candidate division WOR-3 bacterium]|nr:type II secretion system protein [candidate division WOR-3 bacterium]